MSLYDERNENYEHGYGEGYNAGHDECEKEINEKYNLVYKDDHNAFQDYILRLWFDATNLESSKETRAIAQEKINTIIYRMAHSTFDNFLPTKDLDVL